MATKAQMGQEIADLLVEKRDLWKVVDSHIDLIQRRDEEIRRLKEKILELEGK